MNRPKRGQALPQRMWEKEQRKEDAAGERNESVIQYFTQVFKCYRRLTETTAYSRRSGENIPTENMERLRESVESQRDPERGAHIKTTGESRLGNEGEAKEDKKKDGL